MLQQSYTAGFQMMTPTHNGAIDASHKRDHAHALLDLLPPEKLYAVTTLLELMVEPLSRALEMAPVEDEEVTPETAAAINRARLSLARGEGIPPEEMLREFGLSH